MEDLTWQERIPVAKKYDLIVCGGGVAGAAAALSSMSPAGGVLDAKRGMVTWKTYNAEGVILAWLQEVHRAAWPRYGAQRPCVWCEADHTEQACCVDGGDVPPV